MRTLAALQLILCLALAARARGGQPLPDFLKAQAETVAPGLLEFYQDLHAHPELSFQEKRTAQKMAERLRGLGFEVTTGVGGCGVVGVQRNGTGPTVLVRAELDALPVEEQTGLPYASKLRAKDDLGNDVPVMHACGHDMNLTVAVAVATILSAHKERWRGTLLVIGQPAEERGAGAAAMLADGLFTRFPKPDYCLAVHCHPELPVGTVAVGEGWISANVDSVDVTVRGIGGHGAYPHKTKDPVVLSAQIILALQTIVSREKDPIETGVITVGSIHGGTKHNIIPDEVKLQLTVRSFSEEVRRQLLDAIQRVARGQAVAAGMPEDRMPVVKISEQSTPSVYNQPELAQRVRALLKPLLGEDNVRVRKPQTGGDDFARFGRTPEKIPCCMLSLGTEDPKRIAESERSGKPLPSLHSGLYHPVADATLKNGARAMSAIVLDLLKEP